MIAKRKNPYIAPYKIVIVQDGQKVFKDSGSKEKVAKGLNSWFKFK